MNHTRRGLDQANSPQVWYFAWDSILSGKQSHYTPVNISNAKGLSQSFIGGIAAYKALPRPQFTALQQKIFPIYFSLQTALPVVLALTYPGSRTGLGTASGYQGIFAEPSRGSVLVPLATIFVTGLANLTFIGPATTNIMKERKHQGISLKYIMWRRTLVLTIDVQKLETERRATTQPLTQKRWLS